MTNRIEWIASPLLLIALLAAWQAYVVAAGVSAFILPPTLISGIFGMNVDGLPFREASPNGFTLTLALMAGSVAVLLLVLRRLKLV